jgi:hypothetical protein
MLLLFLKRSNCPFVKRYVHEKWRRLILLGVFIFIGECEGSGTN